MKANPMSRSTLRSIILILGLATAVLHLYAGLNPMRPPLIVNAIGYLALCAAFYFKLPFLKGRERLVQILFLIYTIATILLWIPAGDKNLIGYSDKVIEVLLAIALVWNVRAPKSVTA